MQVLLIRHGRQADVRCNVDVGLSAAGRRQMALVGARLAGTRIDLLCSSDMVRAREGADLVDVHLHAPRAVVPALRELDFGDMEGLHDHEIVRMFADFQREQARMEQDLRYPGGESVGEVRDRAAAALAGLAGEGAERIAVVTHGVVIRALVTAALGAPVPRWRSVAPSLENGSITTIALDPASGAMALDVLNDHAHLEPFPELLRSVWGVREN
ncbi:histidine phosphatase family protein [Brachybacterium hainanense]|uniref:Histidine phosphatase family protein n=1 Tax=Brachybacterium hainanense TaxID=1541174 RepID=A0ABV6RCQ2_9MICO